MVHPGLEMDCAVVVRSKAGFRKVCAIKPLHYYQHNRDGMLVEMLGWYLDSGCLDFLRSPIWWMVKASCLANKLP